MKIRTIISLVLFVSCLANAAVVSNPILPTLFDLGACDSNSDGFATFDLTQQTPIILAAQSTAASDYTVNYYTSQMDANLGFNAISNANSYYNIANLQTIYVRVTNLITNEYSVGTFNLNAYPPTVPTFTPIAPICQYTTPPVLPIVSTDGILGTWSPSTIDTSIIGTSVFTFTPDAVQCATPVTVTITVTAASTLTLVSAIPTTNQTGCINQPITDIVYQFGGVATGATVIGLPASFSATISGSTVTISGSGATIGVYPYTITAIGGCNQSLTGTITVGTTSTLTLISAPSTTNQTLCWNAPTTDIVYQIGGGATGAHVSGLPPGVTTSVIGSVVTIYGAPAVSGLFPFTVTTIGGCSIQTLTGSITVLRYPTIHTNYALQDVLCVDYNSNTVINPIVLQASSYYFGPPMSHTYQWYMNGVAIVGANNSTYLVDTPDLSGATRNYSVEFTDVTAMGCQGMSSDFQIIQSGPASPIGIGYSIVNNSGNQTITVEVEGYGTYKYALDGGPAQFSPIFSNVSIGLHTIIVTDTEGGTTNSCSPLVISNVDVNLTTTPPPTGNTSQSFSYGATLGDVVVSGQNIQWYSGANKNATSMPLPLSTVLVNGTTYYASQKIGGYESTTRLPVTVQVSLNTAEFELTRLTYAPNPVASQLHLKGNEIIDNIAVYNLLGQLVYNQKALSAELEVDLSELKSGNYFVKVSSGTKTSTLKIVKE